MSGLSVTSPQSRIGWKLDSVAFAAAGRGAWLRLSHPAMLAKVITARRADVAAARGLGRGAMAGFRVLLCGINLTASQGRPGEAAGRAQFRYTLG